MNNKYLKRIALASVPITAFAIVAPLATNHSLSLSAAKVQKSASARIAVADSTQADFQSFLTKVNDIATDDFYSTLLAQDVNTNALRRSVFYNFSQAKIKHDAYRFNVRGIENLIAKMSELFASPEFGDELKIAIGKWVVSRYSFTNFFEDKGFWKGVLISQKDIDSDHGTANIADPFNVKFINGVSAPTDYLYDSKPIKLQGATGLNGDFDPTNANDNEFSMSNQDVFNYFFGAIANSNEFNSLLENFAKNKNLRVSDPKTMSLKKLFTAYYGDVHAILHADPLALDQLFINYFGHLNILSTIDLSFVNTDDEVYVRLLNSFVGEEIYGDQVAQRLIDFSSYTNEQDRQYDMNDLLRKLESKLHLFQTVNQASFASIVSNTTDVKKPLLDKTAADEIFKFAKLLFAYSGAFKNGVKIRLVTSEFNENAIYVSEGRSSEWNQLTDHAFSLNRPVVAPTVEKTTIQYVDYVAKNLPGTNK